MLRQTHVLSSRIMLLLFDAHTFGVCCLGFYSSHLLFFLFVILCRFFFFFFQAEDGIRDIGVTGVQTCALPIFPPPASSLRRSSATDWARGTSFEPWSQESFVGRQEPPAAAIILPRGKPPVAARSEERRVGKECRSRRSPCHERKNKWTTE